MPSECMTQVLQGRVGAHEPSDCVAPLMQVMLLRLAIKRLNSGELLLHPSWAFVDRQLNMP